jgi:hypothetical protein
MRTRAARLYVSPRTRPLTAEEQETRRIAYALKEADPEAVAVAAVRDGPPDRRPLLAGARADQPRQHRAESGPCAGDQRSTFPARGWPRTCTAAPRWNHHAADTAAPLGPIPVDAHGFTRRGPPLTSARCTLWTTSPPAGTPLRPPAARSVSGKVWSTPTPEGENPAPGRPVRGLPGPHAARRSSSSWTTGVCRAASRGRGPRQLDPAHPAPLRSGEEEEKRSRRAGAGRARQAAPTPTRCRSGYHLALEAPGRARSSADRPSRFPRRPSPEPPSAPLSKRNRLGGRPLIRRLADARGHQDGDDIGFAGPGVEPPTPRPLWDRLGRRPFGVDRPAEDRALIDPVLGRPRSVGASAPRSPRRFVATCSPPR